MVLLILPTLYDPEFLERASEFSSTTFGVKKRLMAAQNEAPCSLLETSRF